MKNLKLILLSIFLLSFNAFSKTSYKHHSGEIELDSVPKRVVVLGPDSLDILDTLGIEPVGLVKTIIPTHLRDKYQDKKYTAVGSLKEPNFETIFTLKPDLIIATSRSLELHDDLSQIAPTIVLVTDNGNFLNEVKANWRLIGDIFNKQELVENEIKALDQKVNELKRKISESDLNAMTIMTNGGRISNFGAESRFSIIYKDLGFHEVTKSKKETAHGSVISFEFISNTNPDVMFVLDRDMAIGKAQGAGQKTLNNPLVNNTKAYKDGRMIFLDPIAWYTSVGGIQSMKSILSDIEKAFN